MPRFLLAIIFILVILGQIFAVKDYTIVEPEEDTIFLEDLYFDEKYVDIDKPIQIIKIPGDEEKLGSSGYNFEKSGNNCVYFNNKGIPYLENCNDQEEQDIFSTDF